MPMPDQDRAGFRERLGMYLLGIAIGFVILGLIFTMRRRAVEPAPGSPPTPSGTAVTPR